MMSVAMMSATETGNLPARVVGTYLLPDIVVKFRKQFSTDVQIQSGRSLEVLRMVLDGDMQLGIARAIVHPDIETLPLYD